MGKQEEKFKLKRLKALIKETPEQRKARVSSGLEPKAKVFPDKKKEENKKRTRKKYDLDERN